MTITIAVFNQAGGVAKTTLVQNLGYHLGRKGHSVLVIDMDPQASLTSFMGLSPEEVQKTVYHAVVDQESLPVYKNIYGVDLVPTNINLSAAELKLSEEPAKEGRLKAALQPLQQEYEFALIDCPPSLGLLSTLSLNAATHVLVPIETQFKAFEGANLLLGTIAQVQRKLNPTLAIAGFVPTRYDARNAQDTRTLGTIRSELADSGHVFPPIPRSTAFADAAEQRKPLAEYARKHPAIAILEHISATLEAL